jgi:outer membrane protein
MKKVLLVAAVAVFGLSANAQEETTNGGFAEGDLFISGSVGYSSESTGDVKSNQFEIIPRLGYFVSENIALGLQLGYQSSKDETPTGDTEANTFTVGAFGRYYFMPASQFSLFGQLGIDYISTDYDAYKESGFGVALAPGISYFVSNNIALEATFGILGYKTVEPDVDGSEPTNTFNFGVDMSDINFGIVYKF